jgi:hypothetical protein
VRVGSAYCHTQRNDFFPMYDDLFKVAQDDLPFTEKFIAMFAFFVAAISFSTLNLTGIPPSSSILECKEQQQEISRRLYEKCGFLVSQVYGTGAHVTTRALTEQ